MATSTRSGTPTAQPHICPLCEATCGLAVTTEGGRVIEVRGDPDDVFSRGYACPKGLRIADLHDDPDRLRQPLVDGEPAGWHQAWQVVAERLGAVIERHGRERLGIYLGNPNVHSLGASLYSGAVIRALGTRQVFTASTLDQMPKQVAALLMYGDGLSIPVPDVDRTELLVVIGADPLSSNGSLWTAPDLPGRLRALRRRGGRLVVVDPRMSRTARVADQHLAIRPGTDALLLAAIAHVLLTEGLARPAREHVTGIELLAPALAEFTPEAVAGSNGPGGPTGLAAAEIRELARQLAAAGSAVVYGRIGTCTTRFGTLTSWLIEVINALTGNLDRAGGAMFPLAAAGQRNSSPTTVARAPRFGRYATSVRGLPEVMGELPAAALVEEIEAGAVRGLVTLAGNPALSAPGGPRWDGALAGLEVMISVDCYRNETTRHADVVLPVPGPLQRNHFDVLFSQLAVRNIAHFTPPLFDPALLDPALPAEWVTLATLAAVARGGTAGPTGAAPADDAVLADLLGSHVAAPASPVYGRDVAELVAELNAEPHADGRRGELRLLDAMLRLGPYGNGFGARPDGLTLDRVAAHPHGLDLGPLQPRLPEVLRTVSGLVELAPAPLLADLPRLAASLTEPAPSLQLVGRRHLRSNNSWGHNVPALVGGSNTCALQVHPNDATVLGLSDGAAARVTSSSGEVVVPVEVTDTIRPGVVSLPHGWGHHGDGVALQVATAHAGANSNALSPFDVEPLSGTAILSGFPVEVTPV